LHLTSFLPQPLRAASLGKTAGIFFLIFFAFAMYSVQFRLRHKRDNRRRHATSCVIPELVRLLHPISAVCSAQ
jgi:hypothetical protein